MTAFSAFSFSAALAAVSVPRRRRLPVHVASFAATVSSFASASTTATLATFSAAFRQVHRNRGLSTATLGEVDLLLIGAAFLQKGVQTVNVRGFPDAQLRLPSHVVGFEGFVKVRDFINYG
ncbi:MAG: hypothetical protein VX973_10730 [Pseudomonadota bacterium]|nr:hypothetical protein [Pseudomonadota bacterium]